MKTANNSPYWSRTNTYSSQSAVPYHLANELQRPCVDLSLYSVHKKEGAPHKVLMGEVGIEPTLFLM